MHFYIVNVCVALHRDGQWLLIVRGAEAHAPGTLALVGGKCDDTEPVLDVLEHTARREVEEEVGVDLSGVALTYAESVFFRTDQDRPAINVVFVAPLPAGAQPTIVSPAEVADIRWHTLADIQADAHCPPWTRRSIERASITLDAESRPAPR